MTYSENAELGEIYHFHRWNSRQYFSLVWHNALKTKREQWLFVLCWSI